jgi:hypothetical protein
LIPDLAEKEWKFDSVPPDEIEACFFYEYGRETANHLNGAKNPGGRGMFGSGPATWIQSGNARSTAGKKFYG